MSATLTNEEKKQIAKARQSAVRHAWKEEQARVKEGFGTRNWSSSQQKEIIERGSVKGYDGHHMKSVSKFPEYAGNSKNIQFLSEEEHFEGAHNGSFHNLTNGYYDPETKTMLEFDGDELKEVPVNELSEKYSLDNSTTQENSSESGQTNTIEQSDEDGESEGEGDSESNEQEM